LLRFYAGGDGRSVLLHGGVNARFACYPLVRCCDFCIVCGHMVHMRLFCVSVYLCARRHMLEQCFEFLCMARLAIVIALNIAFV
jgi:hypothetical protein